jgi:16S rRNA (uracil1498-N3)-methyltransferase
MTRIFIDKELSVGVEIALAATQTRHLVQVLRARVGAPVTLFNGRGGEYRGVIVVQNRREAVVRVDEFCAIERESPLAITLVQGISRGERMDYSIQKAVELGVACIVPFQSERTNVRLSAERAQRRMQHWHGIIAHACEQSGRNRIPNLESIHSLEQVSAISGDVRFVMNPAATGTPSAGKAKAKSAVLVVGPEGGLDEHELTYLNRVGFIDMRLGPRVLRTETAAITGLSILQARYGDFR